MLKAMCGMLVLSCLTVPASAGTFSEEKCAAFAAFAQMVMLIHQHGSSTLEGMLAIADKENDQSSKDFEREMIRQAFQAPRFLGDSKTKQVEEFRDKVRLACLHR